MIKGTKQEIEWALEGLATIIPCGECPYERICSEINKKEESMNAPVGFGPKCEDVLRKHLTLVEEE